VTATTIPVDPTIGARSVGFLADLRSVAHRALLLIPRDVEGVVPALMIPVFFFVVNIGSLQSLTESTLPGFDYKAFQLPVAIIFAVTGISRAPNLVTDIQDGYFDRMLVTPMSRHAFLLGLMVADYLLVVALCIPVVALGLVLGVTFESGPLGILVFVGMAGLWGLVFTGFPYAIALKTGSPAAVNSSFLLFFPFAFLTTAFVPEDQLTGWLATIAAYNPVTYILEALRSLLFVGWDAEALLKGLAAIAAVGVVSQALAFTALRGRLQRG
jgi:ABC-2 type transport system permease protein